MSVPHTAAPARPTAVPFVRAAVPADYPAIREVVTAAYRQYADLIPPDIFSPYLAGLLDLDMHASRGRMFIVEADERVCAFGAFYPDGSAQGYPPGCASGRALAVHPDARGNGAARALLAVGEYLALRAGSPVLAFHTHSYMTGAIALYERLGYRRAPDFDLDLAAHYRRPGKPIPVLAYLRYLTEVPHPVEHPMTTRARSVSTPAYYLARPAALWLTALRRRPANATSPHPSCAEPAPGPGTP
jgi:GNAT superfamily N-acetyltransferase